MYGHMNTKSSFTLHFGGKVTINKSPVVIESADFFPPINYSSTKLQTRGLPNDIVLLQKWPKRETASPGLRQLFKEKTSEIYL
ncbi:hypothetical protein CEXT_580771 [Caerostris extrusa]|uniref:Uncharacterized protein n=1 Tax=Caerostris extrusa TaxID=172846 RepID=A0AAV4V1W4_CAEEX|nr:hypothetical protein CEXT_580771 [Caerostris extrusa]